MFGQRGKVFDCIEHKRRVQKKVLEDYEARKDEFASYAGFISRGASACAARPNGRRVGRDQGVAGEDCGGRESGGVVMLHAPVSTVVLLVEEPVILFGTEPRITDDLADEGPHDVL